MYDGRRKGTRLNRRKKTSLLQKTKIRIDRTERRHEQMTGGRRSKKKGRRNCRQKDEEEYALTNTKTAEKRADEKTKKRRHKI